MDVQKTLNQELCFSGIGVHSGKPSNIILRPQVANHGIIFHNKSFPGEEITIGTVIPEIAMHATVVRQKNWMLSTIEHLMAALYVFGVDNVEVMVEGSEIPILDGSALPFVQGIKQAGIKPLDEAKQYITPTKDLAFEDEKGRSIKILPAQREGERYDQRLFIQYCADFNHPLASSGCLEGWICERFFTERIAPARTFGFVEQMPFLRKHGLAKGTSLGNTLVIGDEDVMNDSRIPDELICHKYLDLIGDLSLLGKALAGSVQAHRTGHSFNRLVIEHYLKHPDAWDIF